MKRGRHLINTLGWPENPFTSSHVMASSECCSVYVFTHCLNPFGRPWVMTPVMVHGTEKWIWIHWVPGVVSVEKKVTQSHDEVQQQ